MNDREITVTAVVMRDVNMGDSAKALTCFTKELGRISDAASGAKKITGKLSSATSLFTLSRMRLIKGKGEMYKLVGADVLESFYNITSDYDSYTSACNLTVKTLKIIQDQLEDSQLFDLYISTLRCLSLHIKEASFVETVYYIKLTDISGWGPDIDELYEKGLKKATLLAIKFILENDNDRIYNFTVSQCNLLELEKLSLDLIDKIFR